MVKNGYAAVSQTELWDWLKKFRPNHNEGFMFSNHENITRIGDAMESQPNPPGHSGASFGLTMRHLHYIAKHGLDGYKAELMRNSN